MHCGQDPGSTTSLMGWNASGRPAFSSRCNCLISAPVSRVFLRPLLLHILAMKIIASSAAAGCTKVHRASGIVATFKPHHDPILEYVQTLPALKLLCSQHVIILCLVFMLSSGTGSTCVFAAVVLAISSRHHTSCINLQRQDITDAQETWPE